MPAETHARITEILKRHGFWSGRLIAMSKSGYCRRHRNHHTVFNAKLLTKNDLILQGADLDLTLDGEKLTAAAREAGEDFFVLHEGCPSPFWEPEVGAVGRILGNAVWWTQTQPANQNLFLPIDIFLRQRWRNRLHCTTGIWLGQAAYEVNCWDNDLIYNRNLAGSAIELVGFPPRHFAAKKCGPGEKLSTAPSQSRGRPVRPVFYHRSGPIEYVWFSHGASVSAVLFANTVGKLVGLSFTIHAGTKAIHIRQAGNVVGLLRPNSHTPPHLVESARVQLRSVMNERQKHTDNAYAKTKQKNQTSKTDRGQTRA